MDLVEVIRQVVDGEVRAPFVLSLVHRLFPEDSMTGAMHAGGRDNWVEHHGWGKNRHMTADLFDVIQMNTQATGNWKNKAPDLPKYPRPKTASEKNKQITLDDVHRAWMGKLSRDSGKGVILGV